MDLVSPVVAAVVSAVVGWWLNRDVKDEVRSQRRELAELKDRRVVVIEERIERHLSTDQTQALLTELRHISTQCTAMTQQLSLAREEIAALKAQRAADLGYLENVNRSLQDHRREVHGNA